MRKLPLFIFFLILINFFLPKVTPNILAQQKEINEEEIEVIIPEKSIFCTDFGISYHQGSKEEVVADCPSETSSCDPNNTAEIWLEGEETKQPDFSIMNFRLDSTRPKLMPLQLNEKVNLDTGKITTRAKHFVVSENTTCPFNPEDTPSTSEVVNSIPETEFTLPDWWTTLLSQTKIFCGLFSASERCQPPEKLTILIDKPDNEEKLSALSNDIDINDPEYAICDDYGELARSQPPELKDIERTFNFTSLKKKIIAFFEELKKYFQTTTREANLTNKTRGVLVGGHTLTNQSEFFSDFLIHEINDSLEKDALAGNAKYGVSQDLEITEPDKAEKEHYQEQNQTRARYCLQLCSLYPNDEKFDVNSIDPICGSCNPKYYQNQGSQY